MVDASEAVPLADRLLARFGSLSATLAASRAGRAEILGDRAAIEHQLAAVGRAHVEALREPIEARTPFHSWTMFHDYLRAAMAFENVEQLRTFYLDAKNNLIVEDLTAIGTTDQVPIYRREIVARALTLGASALVLVHNHPSGDATPSRGDIDATRRLAQACAAIDVTLHDHIIIGRRDHSSFRELRLI